jgi:Outer membrane protein beta-barrel domain
MKKTIFIVTTFIICLNITALSQKTRVGLTGGISFANLSKTIGGADKDGEYRIGIMGGMLLDFPVCKKISFQPDLHYIQKGASFVPTTPVFNKIYTALRYAELAPNFVYNFTAGKGVFYLGGGPYISFNLPSKDVTHAAGADKVETDVSFGNTLTNELRGVDYGGNVVMGFRMGNGIFVSANYIQGVRNLVPKEISDLSASANDKIKNIAFGIRVGYLFKNASKEKK